MYMLAKGCTGEITVNAQNVKFVQEDTITPLKNVNIVVFASDANLSIEGLNISNEITKRPTDSNTDDKNIINFQGKNNTLIVEGDNKLTLETVYSGMNPYSAAIHIGDGLTIKGKGLSSLYVFNKSQSHNPALGAAIGSNGREKAVRLPL